MQVAWKQKLERTWLCFKYVSSQMKGLFQVSRKGETSSTFYLTWTDLNNNLKNVNYYLTLQLTGTYEGSCFYFRLYYWKANWKAEFLIVNVHKTSDEWSYDNICTFSKCTKSTKCYGTLKAISRSSLQKCEGWRNENYLRKSTLKGLTADCVRRKIKIIKTVYSQELNKIKKSKKSCAETKHLYKPKLVCALTFVISVEFCIFWGQLHHNCMHTRCTELIPFPNPVPYANRYLFLLLFPIKFIFHSTGRQQLHTHQHALLL
jgi:hypothetical protein